MMIDSKSKIDHRQSKIGKYPRLSRSFKNKFPFKVACPSYIYPDAIIPNVRELGPFVDEIELILFESRPDSLPTPKEIRLLESLAGDLGITYNIHLPLDVYLGSRDESLRKHAVETIRAVIDLTAPLDPTTHTLHLVYDDPAGHGNDRDRWKSLVSKSLEELLGNRNAGKPISIETLSYPLAWIDDIMEAFDLDVCLDVGHLIVSDAPLQNTMARYRDRISIYHLHGVREGRDHRSLDNLSEESWSLLTDSLKRFQGVVSLEVFSFHRLERSFAEFEKHLSPSILR